MSKKKTILKIAIVVMLVIAMFVAGYTYSKYKSTVAGSITGNVAKWSFSAQGANGVALNNISLINTANNISTANNTIAPGTSGSFGIVIDATGSEVGVDYSVEVTDETINPSHLKFYLNDGSQNPTKYDSLSQLAANTLHGTIPVNAENKTQTLNIGWEWPFEGTGNQQAQDAYDETDLTIANEIETYSFGLNIIGQQVAPTNN